MYVFYLDDSYQDQSSIMTMAGYIQSAEDWSAFEVNADAAYQEFGVDELHTMDFHGTKGCFKGWSYKKKKAFLQQLYAGMPSVFGVSQSVQSGSAANLAKIANVSGWTDYSMAFMQIMTGIENHPVRHKLLAQQGMRVVVEGGNKHDGSVKQTFEDLQKNPRYESILREFQFTSKAGSKAIQLADLLAFYSRRHRAKVLKYGNALTEKISLSHQEKLYTLITSFGPHLSAVSINSDFKFIEAPDGVGPMGDAVEHPETTHMNIHALPPQDP